MGTAGSGEYAEVHFREADFAAGFCGDAQIGGQCDFETTSHGVAVEGGDDELGGVLEAVQGLVRVKAEVVFEVGFCLVEHADVGAGTEEFVAGAGEDENVDGFVHSRVENRRVQLLHHLVAVGVCRRRVELENRDAFVFGDIY